METVRNYMHFGSKSLDGFKNYFNELIRSQVFEEKSLNWKIGLILVKIKNLKFYSTLIICPNPQSIKIMSPVLNSFEAPSTPTRQGRPYSLAITAPWDISPPISVASPESSGKYGLQPMSVRFLWFLRFLRLWHHLEYFPIP